MLLLKGICIACASLKNLREDGCNVEAQRSAWEAGRFESVRNVKMQKGRPTYSVVQLEVCVSL